MAKQEKMIYTYVDAGFNPFLRRSIDGGEGVNLNSRSALMTTQSTRELNFDQQQTTGRLGDKIQVADSLVIDGVKRRFVVIDELGNEVVWLGRVDV